MSCDKASGEFFGPITRVLGHCAPQDIDVCICIIHILFLSWVKYQCLPNYNTRTDSMEGLRDVG